MRKPDIILSSAVLQPCVYAFWLGNRCRYVGQSKQGLKRPFDHKHQVWHESQFQFDRLEVFHTTLADLDSTEQEMIRTLAPRFNTMHHPVHQNTSTIKNLLNRCEIAMIHEQDKLTNAPAQTKRVYEHAAREIIQLVNFR